MKALEYILKHYQKSENEGDGPVLIALLRALSPEELKTLQRKIILCGRYRYYYSDELYKLADRVLKRNNESVSVLLKNFESKDQVTRLDARYRLRDRFGEQSKVIQIKILKAFLHGSKEDRYWAYLNCCGRYWDDSLEKDIKFLWEKYREKECARVVIDHFPIDYLIDNMEILYPNKYYDFLCMRLMNYPLFTMDINRLPEHYGSPDIEYLFVLANSNATIEKGRASQILYKHIIQFVNENINIPLRLYKHDIDLSYELDLGGISTSLFNYIEYILDFMGNLGLVEEIQAYKKWDKKVNKIYKERSEKWERDYHLYNQDLWSLYCSVIVECLPKKYQGLVSNYVRSASATLPDFKECPF